MRQYELDGVTSDGLLSGSDQDICAIRLVVHQEFTDYVSYPKGPEMSCRICETQQPIWQPARLRPQGMPHQFFESFAGPR